MYALISPTEKVVDVTGAVLGDRVAEVVVTAFSVASPLFWAECSSDVVADQFYWFNGSFFPVPPPPPPPPVVLPEGGGPAVL